MDADQEAEAMRQYEMRQDVDYTLQEVDTLRGRFDMFQVNQEDQEARINRVRFHRSGL